MVRRFLAAEERFESVFQLRRYLRDNEHLGWKKAKKQRSGMETWLKRVGGIWWELSWFDFGAWDVYLSPTTLPKSISITDFEAYQAAHDKLRADLPVKGLTMSAIDRKLAELVKLYREMSGPRKKQDLDNVIYLSRGLKGEEGLKAWKQDVERYLVKVLEEQGEAGRSVNTRWLMSNIRTEFELYTRDSSYPSRAVRAMLDRLLREGKINRDPEGNWTKW